MKTIHDTLGGALRETDDDFCIDLINQKEHSVVKIGMMPKRKQIAIYIGIMDEKGEERQFHHALFFSVSKVYRYQWHEGNFSIVFENVHNEHLEVKPDGQIYLGKILNL